MRAFYYSIIAFVIILPFLSIQSSAGLGAPRYVAPAHQITEILYQTTYSKPSIAVHDDVALVAWEVSGAVEVALVTPTGITTKQVGTGTGYPNWNVKAFSISSGAFFVVWASDLGISYVYTTDDGATFSAQTNISGSPRNFAACSSGSALYLAWFVVENDGNRSSYDVHGRIIDDSMSVSSFVTADVPHAGSPMTTIYLAADGNKAFVYYPYILSMMGDQFTYGVVASDNAFANFSTLNVTANCSFSSMCKGVVRECTLSLLWCTRGVNVRQCNLTSVSEPARVYADMINDFDVCVDWNGRVIIVDVCNANPTLFNPGYAPAYFRLFEGDISVPMIYKNSTEVSQMDSVNGFSIAVNDEGIVYLAGLGSIYRGTTQIFVQKWWMEGDPPAAKIVAPTGIHNASETLTFDGSSSEGAGNLTYRWRSNGRTIGTASIISTKLDRTPAVNLTVTDTSGRASSREIWVSIRSRPAPQGGCMIAYVVSSSVLVIACIALVVPANARRR